MDESGEWNPAVINGDPQVQCTAQNGCQCLLGDGHDGDHRCGHGYWQNLTQGVLPVTETDRSNMQELPPGCPGPADCDAYTVEHGCICPRPMTRSELVERIMFAVDGYRLGEWTLIDAGARISKLIEQNPQAV